MAQVQGISGTSAGAITALMLSTRMTARNIENELLNRDFNTFFDPPLDRQGRRLVPRPLEYAVIRNNDCEEALLSGSTDMDVLARVIRCLHANHSVLAKLFWGLGWMYRIQGVLGVAAREIFASQVLSRAFPSLRPVLTILMPGLAAIPCLLRSRHGFFLGKAARDYFELLLRQQATRLTGNPAFATGQSMTFRAQGGLRHRPPALRSRNFSTGKSVLFSHKHTPNFPVADAVRISMSLPGYKPYVISRHERGWPPCGTYVDGGVWNNLPFREIGSLERLSPRQAKSQTTETSVTTLFERRGTLGLRLEITDPVKVLRGGDLVGKFFAMGMAAGEAQVIADIEPFTIVLDTQGLELLVFRPPQAIQTSVTTRARRTTYRYFGKSPPEDGQVTPEALKVQEEEERRAKERRERMVCD